MGRHLGVVYLVGGGEKNVKKMRKTNQKKVKKSFKKPLTFRIMYAIMVSRYNNERLCPKGVGEKLTLIP